MVTYLYWLLVLFLTAGVAFAGFRFGTAKIGLLAAALVFLVGFIAYHFHYQQLFVKRYGGVMTISVPSGQRHIASTWKDDHLWVENYDPATNQCIFSEYSKGNLLEGKVVIKNCNPLMPNQ
ncbi:hypothetical protein [Biformimicrobium ophioploci]|uniref:Uncharacterized protein n=1 Tax=Biformimicrobium ophioploci TaxID=3036711 RepID=A0ABQ6LY24_9GAMM|nr:hypothetical protein [Microbulbifer sp. NKW57]GMG86941.1 hypothetical protein MNKW57_12620 [Microbulbifer sp. NKW57]